MRTASALVTDAHLEQFREEGYFFLERAIPPADLDALRAECDRLVQQINADMDARGVTVDGIIHRDKRYFIAIRNRESEVLRNFLFGDLMADITRAVLGDSVYLFWEQFVVKAAEVGMKFGWHQDSGYVGHDHRPYLTLWCPLDDVNEENGTVYVLPFSRARVRRRVDHRREADTNDLIGYFGDDPGVPVVLPAGGIAAFSSVTFHRSGANTTSKPRRVYIPQYSPEVIMTADGSKPFGLSDSFIIGSKRVAT